MLRPWLILLAPEPSDDFELSCPLREPYTCLVQMRRMLVVISVLATGAALIAVVEGAWAYGLAIYAVSGVGLGVLLRRAVTKQRTQIDPPLRTARRQT